MLIKKICWLIAILVIAFSGEFSHASVAPKATKITVKVGKGGAIYPAKKTSLSSGESKTFSVEPDIRNGYHINNILIDRQAVSVGNAHIPFQKTFNYDGKNHSIQALFALNKYEVSLIAGPGGVISPTMQTITHGTKNVVFFVNPDIDFNISDVKVNGISKGPISQIVIDVVTGPLEITATFENKYISVTSLSEGEMLCNTRRYRISWQVKIPSPAAKIDLLFSRDGGSTWENIATLPANTTRSSYDWLVPNVLSDICKIKVALIDNMGPCQIFS